MTVDLSKEAVRIDVQVAGRISPIWIGDGVMDRAGAVLDAHRIGARRFIVSSPAIWRFHGERVVRALGATEPILIPDGERFKNLQTVARIYEALIRAGADRGSTIVAVGGGVIGDTAGFAAATYLRGIALAHVPTTLLDRKSTRLNSSHLGISYAVFCLKKKKRT